MFSKRKLAFGVLSKSGLTAFLRRCFPWSGVLCLNYHRVGDGSRSLFDRQLWSATAEEFDAQVHFLKKDFDLIMPDDLDEVRLKRQGRYALLTFDDGYRDNHDIAFPILKSHDVRATFFVSTGVLD